MGRCGSVIAYCLQIFSEHRKSEFRKYLIFNKAFFHDVIATDHAMSLRCMSLQWIMPIYETKKVG